MNIKEELKALSDEKYRKFHSSLCPGTDNILGVRVPVLRNYAKKLNQQYPLEYLLTEVEDKYYEEIMLKGMLIGFNKQLEWKEAKKHIQKFVPKINNWAICDVFCAGLKITHKYPEEMWELIQQYVSSQQEFEVRFAIVMMIDYYINEKYLQKDFAMMNTIQLDQYYVKMAIAWAISICLIKFYDETIIYLKQKSTLDDWTYHKAIQKARESYRLTNKQKEELKKIKRE